MNLKELIDTLTDMYNRYGCVDVLVDLTADESIDDTLYIDKDKNNISTENIIDVTEVKDNEGKEVTGIVMTNYYMVDNNWGV